MEMTQQPFFSFPRHISRPKATGFDNSLRYQTDMPVSMSTFVLWEGHPTCFWNLMRDGHGWMNYTYTKYITSQRPALMI